MKRSTINTARLIKTQLSLLFLCSIAVLPSTNLNARQSQDPCSGVSNQPLMLYYNNVDASGFPKIVSYVTVTNDSNLVIGQLDSSHFVVQEDGVREYPIEVVDLTAEGEAITVVLVMDRSTSMDESDLMDGAIDAAATFVGLLGTNDQAGLVSFGSDVRVDHTITIDKASVISAIRRLKSKGGTHLYDGVLEGAKILNQHTGTGRKALVVLSDGHSKEDSDIPFEQMLAWVETLGFPVYTIGLKERGGTIEKNLITLACRTGGSYYYSPKTDDLSEIYRAIVEMLRHQYRITYTTHNPKRDGTRRQVRITVNALSNTASDTNSYFAPLDLITLSPVTDDIPAPGRTFEIRVIIPESSNPVYEMQDLTFKLTFDPQYLSVLQPLDQGLFAGGLFGRPGEHTISYAVDARKGEITFTLSKEAAAGLISGKGEIARVIFQAATDLPDNIPLTFRLIDATAANGDGNNIRTQLTDLTIFSFGYITLAVTTGDVLQPGSTFSIEVQIPPHSKYLPGMRDIAMALKYDTNYLKLQSPQEQAVQKRKLLEPAGDSNLRFNINTQNSTVDLNAAKKQGESAMQGRGEIVRMTFDVSINTPDSTAFAFELSSVLGRDDTAWEIPFKIENLYIASNGLTVWPGDTDHNGKVELRDVLPLGVHWTLKGPGRPDEPNPLVWKAQLTQRYPVRMAAHADADGTGKVDERDIIPVGLNWGKAANSAQFKKTAQTAMSQVPSGHLRFEVTDTERPDVYKLSIIYDAAGNSPVSGLTFKLRYSQPGFKLSEIKHGAAWQMEPLLVAHVDENAHKLGIGVMSKAGSQIPVNGGELAAIFFEGENGANATDFNLEQAILVTPDGKVHEIEAVAENAQPAENPDDFLLFPAFPNPFNPSTTLQYAIPAPATVEIAIFDAAGREIMSNSKIHEQAGMFSWQWRGVDRSGGQVSSGLYMVRITALTSDGWMWRARQKVTLMK
ncbi:MAG: VWA domain-containing protein [bacterium]